MKRSYLHQLRVVICLLLISLLSACATTNSRDPQDPFESFNRSAFNFNQAMDKNIFNPIGEFYDAILPRFINEGITNFFSNLRDISVIVNDILQLKIGQAVADLARLVFNSTIGLLGFFDVSTNLGLVKHNEDFGQTLAKWGFDSGPYFVIPFFGPTTLRAATSFGVDGILLNPITYINDTTYRSGLMSLNYIDFKADLLGTGELLGFAAVHECEFVKSVYLQHRDKLAYDREDDEIMESDEPDFEDFE
jgi:phospholipid-binding lipoprotein MlaA